MMWAINSLAPNLAAHLKEGDVTQEVKNALVLAHWEAHPTRRAVHRSL